jgi:DNA-directed RNA polymerase subunit RPC12/RpoP
VSRIKSLLGVYPYRCADCSARFTHSLWAIETIAHAHCPRCMRTALGTTWQERYRPASRRMKIKTALGAGTFHCAACRLDFASFRRLAPRRQRVEKITQPSHTAHAH